MEREDVTRVAWMSLYPEALRLKLGNAIPPQMALVHPTNRCNHNCVGCEYARVHTRDAAELDEGRMLTLIDEIADLGAVSILFTGGGEPMMHRGFCAAVEKAKGRGLSIGVFTDGAFLFRRQSECLARNASFVRISIDATSAATFASVRGVRPSQFQHVKRAVKELAAAKRGVGSRLQIGLKFLVRPSNIHEIPSFPELAKELGAESVQYKLLRNGPDEPDAEQVARARALIETATNSCPEGVRVSGALPRKEIVVDTPCWLSPLRVVVSAEGDVHICNYFSHRRETHTFGNIYRQRLSDIWFGDAHRRSLASIDSSQCRLYDCRFHALNGRLADLTANHREQLDFL